MAHVKAQGTQVFAVVDGAVVRFTCPKAFSFGEMQMYQNFSYQKKQKCTIIWKH